LRKSKNSKIESKGKELRALTQQLNKLNLRACRSLKEEVG
jgi:hypothetical protein